MRKIVDSDSVIVTDDYSDGDTTNVRRGDVLRVEDSSREWIYGKFEGSEDRDGETFGIQKVPKYRVQPISEFKWTPKRFRRKLKHKLKRTGKRLSNKGKKGTAWVKEKIRASLNKLKKKKRRKGHLEDYGNKGDGDNRLNTEKEADWYDEDYVPDSDPDYDPDSDPEDAEDAEEAARMRKGWMGGGKRRKKTKKTKKKKRKTRKRRKSRRP